MWRYDPPEGGAFVVVVDARLDPGVQWRRRGTVEVIHGDERVELDTTTWVIP